MACPALEQQYSPQELAEIWGVNEQTIRCMVAAEPAILRINVRRISRGAQREMLALPLTLVARMAPVALQGVFHSGGILPRRVREFVRGRNFAGSALESVGKLGWAEGFEPSATGTTMQHGRVPTGNSLIGIGISHDRQATVTRFPAGTTTEALHPKVRGHAARRLQQSSDTAGYSSVWPRLSLAFKSRSKRSNAFR
jgi:hypothetical protein